MSNSFDTCSGATRPAVRPSYSALRPRCLNDPITIKRYCVARHLTTVNDTKLLPGGTASQLTRRGAAVGEATAHADWYSDPMPARCSAAVNWSMTLVASSPRSLKVPPVYPRVCGGTEDARRVRRCHQGLSPRVRGNQILPALKDGNERSIPACAGEPGGGSGLRGVRGVYPRVCGGTPCWEEKTSCGGGLSPRVRGNRSGPAESWCGSGSIPACAGEPPTWSSGRPCRRVYPRVCGGTSTDLSEGDLTAGLSPRVRGNPCQERRKVYGDLNVGLSPRVRGNQERAGPQGADHGSIPACAGEPMSDYGVYALYEVYPRVCGGTSQKDGQTGRPM